MVGGNPEETVETINQKVEDACKHSFQSKEMAEKYCGKIKSHGEDGKVWTCAAEGTPDQRTHRRTDELFSKCQDAVKSTDEYKNAIADAEEEENEKAAEGQPE